MVNNVEEEKAGTGRRADRFNTLGARLAVAGVGIPLMVGVAWLGGWWLFGLVLALSLLAFREFIRLAWGRWDKPIWLWGLAGVLLCLSYFKSPHLSAGAATLWLMILLSVTLWDRDRDGSIKTAGLCLLGMAYIPILLGHLLLLRDLATPRGFLDHLTTGHASARGFGILVWTLALVWIGDTGAYFSGLLLGRHKLAPEISPNKTVEGLAGGMVVTALAGVGLGVWWRLGLGLWHSLALGILITIFGTLGDLVESKIKRAAGAKDSGSLLPGHGGVLDRFDSLMFAAPVVYWYIKIVIL